MSNIPNKALLDIDLNQLERECQGQSRLMWDWAKELVKARRKVKDLKKALKLRAGELDLACRLDPQGTVNLDKVSEKVVEYYVARDKGYKEIETQLHDAEEGEDLLELFVKSIVSRREDLSDLVKLHGQTYWSKPDTSGVNMDDNLRISRQTSEVLNKPKKKAKTLK